MTDTDRPGPDRLDEVISEALHQHVEGVRADAALLDRIRESVTADVPASGGGHRRHGWLLASAAAVVVAVVAAVLLFGTEGTDEEGVVTDGVANDGGGDGAAPTNPTPGTGPEPTVGDGSMAAALPDRAVLARTSPDGSTARLVLVDLTDGTELATLDTIDNRPCEDEGIAACYVSYAHTTVSAQAELFVERCCEPAGGNVDRHPGLDPDTGALADGQPYLAGYFPTVDPGGTRVAAAGQTAITIRNIGSDDPGHQIDLLEPGQATGETYPTGLAWAPDGRSLAVSLAGPEGGRIVTVPADADSLADGSALTSGEPQAVQAWTGNGRVWVLDAAGGSVASPVRAIDVEDGTTTAFEVLARQVVADRTGTFLYVVTVDGLRRADRNATTPDRLVTSDTILVPSAGDVLGAVSVFDAHTCTTTGEATVDVPDVIGRDLAEARRVLEVAGLTVVDDGSPAGDDTSGTALVTAQEPPAGSRVPAGACVGMRTTVPVAPLPEPGEPLADGRHSGYLRDISLQEMTIAVDVIQWLTGKEADDAYAADTGDTSGAPNDSYIRNTSEETRTLPLRADKATVAFDEQGPTTRTIPLTEFPDYLDQRNDPTSPFWITVEDGAVVAIDEQYRP